MPYNLLRGIVGSLYYGGFPNYRPIAFNLKNDNDEDALKRANEKILAAQKQNQLRKELRKKNKGL